MSDGRDYIADMADAIAEATASGDFVAPVVAEKLHARLLETDPDLLDGWLRVAAVHFLTRAIGDADRRARTTARTRRAPRAMKEATDAAEAGDPGALSIFQTVHHTIDDDKTRRLLGDMTGADHLFVANHHGQTAANARMLEAFHRAVAKKVGKHKTSDVFTEAEYQRLYDSITGRNPGPESKPKAA